MVQSIISFVDNSRCPHHNNYKDAAVILWVLKCIGSMRLLRLRGGVGVGGGENATKCQNKTVLQRSPTNGA
jgi:hypothetical protein